MRGGHELLGPLSCSRIPPSPEMATSLVPGLARSGERHFRVRPDRKQLLLARELVAVGPKLPARGRDEHVETGPVRQLVGLLRRLRFPDLDVRQHPHTLNTRLRADRTRTCFWFVRGLSGTNGDDPGQTTVASPCRREAIRDETGCLGI